MAKKKPLPKGSRIYFIAICGTGMSALAGLLKERGYRIAGSDIAAYPPVGDLLKSLKIPVHIGYDVEDLKAFEPDYVVIGNFVRRDNPQAQWVLDKNIPYGSFPSTLENFFLQETSNIVVLGTHGKTTTTSVTAHLLSHSDLDPSFLIGGVPLNFDQSFHVGDGKYFVIEGDEYDTAFFDKESKFLHYLPRIALFMSLEWDHADIFPTPEKMEAMFRKFLHLIPVNGGRLFYCSDWSRISELIHEEKIKCQSQSFGFEPFAKHRIENFEDGPKGMSFSLDGTVFRNAMSGTFNAQNFAAAILAARECGIPDAKIAEALAEFKGVKRRQEVRAKFGKSLIIDDFAHHPTAVRRVIQGLRAKYPKHRMVVFFEPRSNTSRRNVLQKEWETAFLDADEVFLAPVFKEETLPENERLDLKPISEIQRQHGRQIHIRASQEIMVTRSKEILKKFPESLFVVLSNGSFDGLHEKLISALS